MKRDRLCEFLKVKNIPDKKEEFLKKYREKIKDISKSQDFIDDLTKFNALSNKIRFLIYKLLLENELCTCALAEIFNVSESTITHHLKILEKAGLIVGIKRGYFTFYSTKSLLADSLQLKTTK
ncbi:MAG: ArsR/SmtB family transcription factor [Candidatus Helarchaeota archaeon]